MEATGASPVHEAETQEGDVCINFLTDLPQWMRHLTAVGKAETQQEDACSLSQHVSALWDISAPYKQKGPETKGGASGAASCAGRQTSGR